MRRVSSAMTEKKNNRLRRFVEKGAWELSVPAAMVVLGIVLLADLPEAAQTLLELAATLATYAALLPTVAQRLYDYVPEEAGDAGLVVLTLFVAGAGLAAAQVLEPAAPARAATTVFYLAVALGAGRLCAQAWLGNLSALPVWSLLRLSVGLLALSALAAAGEGIGQMTGLFRSAWLTSGVADGALLAIAFYATASAAADHGPQESLVRLPTRWPELVALGHAGAGATAALQTWLARYPGARATALLALTVAPLVLAAGLLVADALRLREARDIAWRGKIGAAALLLVAEFAFLAGAMLSSLQAAGSVLLGGPASLWPWAWRLVLAVTAVAAWERRWDKFLGRTALPAGLATAAGVAAVILATCLWLTDNPLAGAGFVVAGALLAAAPLSQAAQPPGQ